MAGGFGVAHQVHRLMDVTSLQRDDAAWWGAVGSSERTRAQAWATLAASRHLTRPGRGKALVQALAHRKHAWRLTVAAA